LTAKIDFYPAMYGFLADVLVLVHLAWVLFMVGGVLVTAAGVLWPPLLKYSGWRIVHLVGMLFAGLLSIWGGFCPLTSLEYTLRRLAGQVAQEDTGFIIRLANRAIFPDMGQTMLSAVTIAAGLVVLGVCLWRPPWRRVRTVK
jgi:hypothetical protein